MNPLPYFLDLFKTNQYTLSLFIFLVVSLLVKRFKTPSIDSKAVLYGSLVLGLILRLAWIGFSSYEPQTAWNPKHMLESDIANVHAIELTKGVVFHNILGEPTARRPIGYPLMLGVLYKVFGVHNQVGFVANLVLYLLSALFLYQIAKEIFGERVAGWTIFIFSVYPVSIYSIKMMTDEHLFLPVWYGGLCLLLREMHGKPVRWAPFIYGLIFGYATMTRTHSIFMPLVVAYAYFLLKYSWKKILSGLFITMFAMQLINLPWIIRNYRVWHAPMFYTMSGYNLYMEMNSSATIEGGGDIPKKGETGYSEELQQAIESNNEARYNMLSNREMKRWIVTHPVEFLKIGTGRVLFFLGWNRKGGVWPLWFQYYPGSFDPLRPIAPAALSFLEELAYHFYYVLLFSFVFSVIWLSRRWKELSSYSRSALLVLASCIFFWLAEHMVIFPDRKYRFPLEPLFMITVGAFVDHLVFNFKGFVWKKR